MGCPCIFKTPPLLNLRGACSDTDMNERYTPMQGPDDETVIVLIGKYSSQIQHNASLSQWIIQDRNSNITAMTEASQHTYALGKHNWTISGDSNVCSKHKPSYTIEMKLTGCRQ